ncbi:efflux RND transporter periplasmic adaptor subunit, partial [candidate division KSB1 bacterium]|nr:efflux RND transporter periplasmic adaptor subunit [candidate division KSB1 bacterium]
RALVEYERARLTLSYCSLRAPFSGYVADCELVPGGSYINAGFKCMKLVDLSKINIITEVTESQIGKIRIGHAAEVRFVAYPQKVLRGRVMEINPYIDLEKRTGKVTVEIANPDHRFKPGMFANVRIQGDVVAEALVIPRPALVMRDNRPVVFVAQNGLAKWHYVAIGAENEDFYQITDGISAGDSVIVEGHYNLAHDARIKVTVDQP